MTRRGPAKKSALPVSKAAWHPSPLFGQIVLVSSRSSRGGVHVAAKSWISMVASEPPTISLACRLSHRTAINILETREFVVNVPGEDLVGRVFEAAESLEDSLDGDAGWTMGPGQKVSAPWVTECRAHIECVLDSTKRFNAEEIALYGRIVAVHLDESVLQGGAEERYRHLRPLVYLEEGIFAGLDAARRISVAPKQA